MCSSLRDRTAEFQSATHTLNRIAGLNTTISQSPIQQKTPNALRSSRSEFNKKASLVGSRINETSLNIARLAEFAKRKSVFDDPIAEIQKLTALIRNDIKGLDASLSDLQILQNMEIADGSYSEDEAVHSTTVFDDLRNRLMKATKELKNVLTTRTENIKAHENRKQIFSKNAARENPFKLQPTTVSEPAPWSSPSKVLETLELSRSAANEVQAGNQLRRRPAAETIPTHHMEMATIQQVVPRQESYSQSRAVALHNVESTISELSGIFTHLATIVSHQGEVAIRIDDNMEESVANIEGAHSSLLRHLNNISSNRWLLIKIFAIVVFFLMIFLFFVA